MLLHAVSVKAEASAVISAAVISKDFFIMFFAGVTGAPFQFDQVYTLPAAADATEQTSFRVKQEMLTAFEKQ